MNRPQNEPTRILKKKLRVGEEPYESVPNRMSVSTRQSVSKQVTTPEDSYDSLSDIPENNPVLMREDAWIAQPVTAIEQRLQPDPYPAVSSYILSVNRKKELNNELSVYHVGQRYVEEGRAFGLYLTSPPCNVELFPPKFEEDIKTGRCRVCLTPLPVSEDPMEFVRFIDHLEQLGERLRAHIEKNGESTMNWRLPFKEADGQLVGLYCSVRDAQAVAAIKTDCNNMRLTVKVTCVWIRADACGLSLEVTHAFNT